MTVSYHRNDMIESDMIEFRAVKNDIWSKTPVKMSKALILMIT